jgi:hypothetical protein
MCSWTYHDSKKCSRGQLNDVIHLDPSPKTDGTGLKASQSTEWNQYHLSGFDTKYGSWRVVSVRMFQTQSRQFSLEAFWEICAQVCCLRLPFVFTIRSYRNLASLSFQLTNSTEQSAASETNYTFSESNSPHFMEPEGSSPSSQEPATSPCPEPDESKSHPEPYFSNIRFNIILPSTPRSSEWYLPFPQFHFVKYATSPRMFQNKST